MSKVRVLSIVIGAVLIVSVILIAKAIGPQVGAVSSLPPVGFGDLRIFESRQSLSVSQAQGGALYAGMGDLHLVEAMAFTSNFGAQAGSGLYAGMGDLHLFETSGSLSNPNSEGSGNLYVGMGDLHRFESR
jgi:hypothetical protein